MALNPIDSIHLAQIQAGTVGRSSGHKFEKDLTAALNGLVLNADLFAPVPATQHLVRGQPAQWLVRYIAARDRLTAVTSVKAWWLGGLATSGEGDELLDGAGAAIARSKSDVVVELIHATGNLAVGVSVKTCSKKTPTNDQLYFTTASAFSALLRRHGMTVSVAAENAMKMFCGDPGFKPSDSATPLVGRVCTDRWFWEELPTAARAEWEQLFATHQRRISTILLQSAYANDPFAPSYLLHQTVKYTNIADCPMALFSMEEILGYTCKVGGFSTREYYVRKGRHKDPNTPHLAPRFGYIQFQRAGNKQHPTQLQFNLQAGYFNKLPLEPLPAGSLHPAGSS